MFQKEIRSFCSHYLANSVPIATKQTLSSLFTDRGGKLLLTQVASPKYSIQDDGVLSLLFEPCEYLRIVVSDVLKRQPVDQRRPSIQVT